MQVDALKLDGVEVAVEVRPKGDARLIEAINTAIVAVEQLSIGVEIDSVVVDVRRSRIRYSGDGDAGAKVVPCHAAVGRLHDAVRAGGTSHVNDGRIVAVHDDRHVVPALATQVVGSVHGQIAERGAAVRAADQCLQHTGDICLGDVNDLRIGRRDGQHDAA